MTEDQEREVGRIAELEVRKYFDHYLHEVFPEQVKAIKQHAHVAIAGHNTSPKAHGSSEAKINKVLYAIAGIMGLLTVLVAIKTVFGWPDM